MSEELHIASMILHVLPAHLPNLTAWAEGQSDLEIRASSPEGKVVVVIEKPHQQDILSVIDDAEQQPGVLSCTLVYHEVMSPAEGDQELLHLAPGA
ncbi:chaperone NapD [Pseudomonas sp. NyZ704]|nr:chaperone NapD [Pseudomonas sp. NyZ704]|tara:strand:+ start:5394 stop:5681 length:288 start_codon:yes stop_codon:yes gene_type:complete